MTAPTPSEMAARWPPEQSHPVDSVAADAFRKCAATFIGAARAERELEQRHEVVHRLRLEHRGVEPWRNRLRAAAGDRFLRGHATNR